MTFKIEALTRELMQQNIQDFVHLAKNNIEGEYWDNSNFLSDLRNKWNLSFFVKDDTGKIIAFLIASEKTDSIHIHKFVVDLPARQMGVGTLLLDYLKTKATKVITLKVRVDNEMGIQFYKKKGFVILAREADLYIMTSD
jgi:ribosomal protein S18 acetylase RimI-like enzyme